MQIFVEGNFVCGCTTNCKQFSSMHASYILLLLTTFFKLYLKLFKNKLNKFCYSLFIYYIKTNFITEIDLEGVLDMLYF